VGNEFFLIFLKIRFLFILSYLKTQDFSPEGLIYVTQDFSPE